MTDLQVIRHQILIERWWAKVDQGDPDGCWPWRSSRMKKGYGTFNLYDRTTKKRSSALAHRWGFINLIRELDPGEIVMHTCDNPPCCRPDHWIAGSNSDNIRDCINKGRKNAARGERNRHAKLTETQVREIRTIYAAGGISLKNLGTRYGVAEATIHGIVHRTLWTHVT